MRPALVACSFVCLLLSAVPGAAAVDPQLLAGLEARSIGPAVMSGRIAAVDAVESDPSTFFVGAATGGVWKTVDDGLTFEPLFDDQPVAAIGAVAVFQPSPEVVWVGTGEGNPRNSASVGNGVYRSMDGGETWTYLGLEKSERIHRIVLHPTDPDVAYVAAMGPTWGEGGQRGVYKTVDGGETWTQVLADNATTGAADLVMDPTNPRKLFAALWDHRRWPWSFRSGGPGSGLWVTVDGGENWTRRTPEDGLPEGTLGRIGLAVAASDPSVVYAFVESDGDEHLLLRSDDGGRSFTKRAGSADQPVGNRPFYYADLRVDPQNPDRVYSLWSLVSVSDDGGKTWRVLVPFREVHPDHHAMWINPADSRHIINGNDGGVYVSRDRGEHWRFVRTLPVSQFYQVRVDDDTPYHVYGGLQDNGSWRAPSEVWENGGIREQHWQEVFFGDGFDTLPDPRDSMQGWAMSQEGFLARWNLRTGERKLVRPGTPYCPEGGGEEACRDLRFNWNAGLAIDPFDDSTLYFGSQYVHKSTDRGETWTVISDDLTTDRAQWQRQGEAGGVTLDVTGAENFTTILAISPSPLEEGLLWVGTDDGRLHRTRDGGETWTSLEENLTGVPDNTWIAHIEPSRHDPAEAFVVLDDHRRSNWKPYVYRTGDYGATWTNLAKDPVRGYALTLVQDPVERNLLFLGTEFGLWVSLDGGGSWLPWKHGVPTVSVMDLAIQPRHDDLVIATHGRGVFILDQLGPLRELSAEVLGEPFHLFAIPDAQEYEVGQTGGARFPGFAEFRGENPLYGALLTVALNDPELPYPDELEERRRKQEKREKQRQEQAAAQWQTERPGAEESVPKVPAGGPSEEPAEEQGEDEPEKPENPEKPKLEIEVRDADGEILRSFEHEDLHQGVNRLTWNLRADAYQWPDRGEANAFDPRQGPAVPPGSYTVTVRYGEHSAEAPVTVLGDPRMEISAEDRQARWQAHHRLGKVQDTAVDAIARLQQLQKDIDAVLERSKQDEDEAEAADADAAGTTDDSEAAEDVDQRLAKAGAELKQKADELERKLWSPPGNKGIGPDVTAWSHIGTARYFLSSSRDAPTPAQLAYLERGEDTLRALLPEVDALFAGPVADFRALVEEAAVELLPSPEPLAGALDEAEDEEATGG
ncbi:MAG: hypothetical protein SX243_14235 [Acidobacteriota bacterium]|nr:hypothetical protein [Acidobacteriota bacterium]